MLKKRLGSYKILGQPINRDYTNSLIDLDVQQFVSRYKWSGLPKNIPPMYIERMLYYRGSLCGFSMEVIFMFYHSQTVVI